VTDPLQADVDFEVWRAYFEFALEGSATSMGTPQAVVRQADAIAVLAAKKQLEKLVELKGGVV
jgi:hypothetical protein